MHIPNFDHNNTRTLDFVYEFAGLSTVMDSSHGDAR